MEWIKPARAGDIVRREFDSLYAQLLQNPLPPLRRPIAVPAPSEVLSHVSSPVTVAFPVITAKSTVTGKRPLLIIDSPPSSPVSAVSGEALSSGEDVSEEGSVSPLITHGRSVRPRRAARLEKSQELITHWEALVWQPIRNFQRRVHKQRDRTIIQQIACEVLLESTRKARADLDHLWKLRKHALEATSSKRDVEFLRQANRCSTLFLLRNIRPVVPSDPSVRLTRHSLKPRAISMSM